jgi:hypothetical protein
MERHELLNPWKFCLYEIASNKIEKRSNFYISKEDSHVSLQKHMPETARKSWKCIWFLFNIGENPTKIGSKNDELQ